jgi:NAD(P)-dependent dehydrogenase (short-subunit alcohol dehydrogenase family)
MKQMRQRLLAWVLSVPVVLLLYRVWALDFSLTGFGEMHIRSLTGKVAIVTGANMGLGYETARQLAEHGAMVVMGCRSASKCDNARKRILEEHPSAHVTALLIDLSEPASVQRFATDFKDKFSSLDFLINNAGIMGTAHRRNSLGWEMQFATNHLGHFMLTGHLIDMLKSSKGRVVTHSSGCASSVVIQGIQAFSTHLGSKKMPPVNLTDWNWRDRDYCPWAAYGQTKRANLYFTSEINRRYAAAGVTATACHPGGSSTGLQAKVDSEKSALSAALQSRWLASIAYSQPKDGALPQTYAALAAAPDAFVGPLWGAFGPPIVHGTSMCNVLSFFDVYLPSLSASKGYRQEDAVALWEESVRTTGVEY